MHREFALNHNSRVFVGLKTGKLCLRSGIKIETWLTKVQTNDKCNMFPKVFPCKNGDMELGYHVSHNQEVQAWLTTALAEIARLSGIMLSNNQSDAGEMFKTPDKVWASLDRLNRGVSLPAQRSVFMDFCPPTGIITFPTRQPRRGKSNRK